MKINYRKLSTGNYQGRMGKYYIFINKRPHGKWGCVIRRSGIYLMAREYATIKQAKKHSTKITNALKNLSEYRQPGMI
jgi:hypothetical protein